MNTYRKKILSLVSSGLLTLLTGISHSSHAALALPDSPLFIGSGPQPNIMFALDDSGSMDWGFLTPESDGIIFLGGLAYFYAHPAPDNLNFWTTADEEYLINVRGLTQAQTLGVWRSRNKDYNTLYYDPAVTYNPWEGVDINGNTYTDASPTAARYNPYDPSVGTTDLTSPVSYSTDFPGEPFFTDNDFFQAYYYIWNDDGDGIVEASDAHTRVEIKSANAPFTGSASRNDCAAAPVCTYAEEIQNFANWFTYYRNRDHVLKKATSELIDNSEAYMGLASLQNNNNIGTPVQDMSVQANKDTLLDQLFQLRPSGGTPLRTLLNNVGQYYDDTDGSDAPAALGFTDPSPILSAADGGECQQNFTLLMSDGFWNGSSPSVGNEDGDDDTEFDGGPHADSFPQTLADVAMKYYEEDLSALDNLVPEIEDIDNNTAQHMVTYTVAFGLTGTGLTTPPDHNDSTPPPPWTNPTPNSATTLDDMQHAAFNGRGLFLSASDSQALITSLSDALADVVERNSFSATAVAINSTVLRTSSRLFQAQFNSEDYSGELSAFQLNSDGTLGTKDWDATDNFPAAASRNIFTTITKLGSPEVIEFSNTDLDAVLLQAAVGTSPVGGTSANLINYIRGVQSLEEQNGGIFRDRRELLGDIVNSSPLSSGATNFFYDRLAGVEGTSYTPFLNAKITRFTDSGTGDPFSFVYVGANDGMLHAFDSRTGAERFAYIPQNVQGNLNLLSDPDYGHKFFVDASPSAADAYFTTPGEWRTVLAGALGKGGRTVYAMDITDPENFGETDVLWEFTTTTSVTTNNELGFVFHQPQIVRLNNGDWGVIFGNGFNSDSEKAQLIILDVQDGSIIKIIDTEVGDASNTNGLSMPFLLDENGDLTVDTAYAGDLQGNLWKFDLTGNVNGWDVAFKQGQNLNPLYTALDDQGTATTSDDEPQPITSRPVVVNHPDGGFMVLFGTGKYIENGDNLVPADPLVHTFYGIRDFGSTVPSGRGNLEEQAVLADVEVTNSNGDVVNVARIVSENPVNYQPGTVDGWFIDLLTPATPDPLAEGEMVIANPLARFGRVIFTTFIPGDTPCDRGGESVIMEVDAISGGRLENSVFDYNQDGVIDADDFVDDASGNQVPGSGIFIPATLAAPAVISAEDASAEFKQTSGINTSVTTTMESTGGLTVGRQSWRQLE